MKRICERKIQRFLAGVNPASMLTPAARTLPVIIVAATVRAMRMSANLVPILWIYIKLLKALAGCEVCLLDSFVDYVVFDLNNWMHYNLQLLFLPVGL